MQAVVPSISRERAIGLFSSRARSALAILRLQQVAPTRTELLYVPYHRFYLELSGSAEEQIVHLGVDGVIGEGISFLSEVLELESFEGKERCEFILSEAAARDIALDRYKRLLLEHGLRNKSKAAVSRISTAEPILYPFWIGYFRKGNAYDFKALDAVSAEIQGVRMRKVFLTALRQLEGR